MGAPHGGLLVSYAILRSKPQECVPFWGSGVEYPDCFARVLPKMWYAPKSQNVAVEVAPMPAFFGAQVFEFHTPGVFAHLVSGITSLSDCMVPDCPHVMCKDAAG